MSNLASCGPAVKERTESSITHNRAVGRGFEGAEWGGFATRNYHKTWTCSGVASEMKTDVNGGAQANRWRPARALGEMEGSTTQPVKPIRAPFSTLPCTDISFSHRELR